MGEQISEDLERISLKFIDYKSIEEIVQNINDKTALVNILSYISRINTLSMISPVTNEEKQKLLEALTIKDKIEVLENIISFYLHDVSFNNQTIQ